MRHFWDHSILNRKFVFKDRALSNKGTSAVEFALIAGIFIPLCLAILDAGLLLWTKGVLQSTASVTARCAAISSPACPDIPQFAVTQAGKWAFPGIIAKANVTPAPAIVCISGAPFMKVTITSHFWAGTLLPPPFNSKILSAIAYFPAGSTPCT